MHASQLEHLKVKDGGIQMSNDAAIAAEWWRNHSGSQVGERYAQIIEANGEGYALARGQLAAIIAKGARKGRATGVDAADNKPKRGRKASKKH